MKLVDAKYDPWPQLRLEYIHGGSLEDQGDISVDECIRILYQCLSALVYLHEHKGIVHRDIKPANILVQNQDTRKIYKFADFGLARESLDPTTICGSWYYLAPELFKEGDRRKRSRAKNSYTPAVDIWSLGVVVLECAYGLPPGKPVGAFWCEQIVQKLNQELERPDILKQFLSINMVIMDPGTRASAQDCYDQMLPLTGQTEDHSRTPTSVAYSQNYQQIQKAVPNKNGEDHQTAFYQGARAAIDTDKAELCVEGDTISSAEIQRYIRSSVPSPDSGGSTIVVRKRVNRAANLSSSSERHHTKRRERTFSSSNLGSQDESQPNQAGSLQLNLPPATTSPQSRGFDCGLGFREPNVSAPDAYLTDQAQDPGKWEHAIKGDWCDSEARLAAILLQGLRQAS